MTPEAAGSLEIKENLSERELIGSISDYVRRKGGKNVIRRVLIANNGIAAVKALRSIKRWAYETFANDKAIEFVVMATPEDMNANAEYIRIADKLVKVPGGANNHNYANIKLIVEIAETHEVDAVWAGWGHASENPKLPEALAQAKRRIIWIGPGPAAMHSLGDKIASTIIAQSAGVPCIPWSGSHITLDDCSKGVPKEIFLEACVHSAEEALSAGRKIGYPLMIKASEGGGGKGIRRVASEDKLLELFAQVETELPGSPIFLMQLASECRHLEVQLLADDFGNAIALLGRDCSIQRRHQKIIEEGPVVSAPNDIWRKMEQSAIRLAKEVGYVGAGTVEYLYNRKGEFFFLELNPRLQVEHPVTELITGVNLPAAQLQVAMGVPLFQIPQIRRFYGQNPSGSSTFEFDNDKSIRMAGHVIACRITAENPDQDFQPTSGVIQELNFRSTPDVWGYFSVAANGGVHEYADSQFGHLFAVGDDREMSRRNMVLALKELSIRGEIRTTVEYLNRILETDDFKNNHITTTWLEQVMAQGIKSEKPPTQVAVAMGAVYKAYLMCKTRLKELYDAVDTGRLLKLHYTGLMKYEFDLIYENIKYPFRVIRSGPTTFGLSIKDWHCTVDYNDLSDGGLFVSLIGRGYVVYGHEGHDGFRVIINGQTCVFSKEYDPNKLRAAMAGKLVRYVVVNNAHILKGQAFAEMEVMKMCIPVLAPENGIIHILKPEGSILQAGDLLGTLELDDPSQVKRAQLYDGGFVSVVKEDKGVLNSYALLQEKTSILGKMISGFHFQDGVLDDSLDGFITAVRDPRLPVLEFEQNLSVLSGRIPQSLYNEFVVILERFTHQCSLSRFYWESPLQFPCLEFRNAIGKYSISLPESERLAFFNTLKPLEDVMEKHGSGSHTLAVRIISDLLKQYLEVEKIFDGVSKEDFAIQELRWINRSNPEYVVNVAIAHAELINRNKVVLRILEIIERNLEPVLAQFWQVLEQLADMKGSVYSRIAWKSRQVLLSFRSTVSDERHLAVHTILSTVRQVTGDERLSRLQSLVDHSQEINDILLQVAFDRKLSLAIRKAAIECYIRRCYQMYTVGDISIETGKGSNSPFVSSWKFSRSQQLPTKAIIKRVDSLNDMLNSNVSLNIQAWLIFIENWEVNKDELLKNLSDLSISSYNNSLNGEQEPVNIVQVIVKWPHAMPDDHFLSSSFYQQIDSCIPQLTRLHSRRITFVACDTSEDLAFFTYKSLFGWKEDTSIRNVEPTMATQMELTRLSNYVVSSLSTKSRMVHLFSATPKDSSIFQTKFAKSTNWIGKRLFARVLLPRGTSVSSLDHVPSLRASINSSDEKEGFDELEYAFVQALNCLEVALSNYESGYECNHIFINCLVEDTASVEFLRHAISYLGRRYTDTIHRLKVSEIEFRMKIKDDSRPEINAARFYCNNPTGYHFDIKCLVEVFDSVRNRLVLESVEPEIDSNDIVVDQPYPLTLPFQFVRQLAAINQTIWVYDFLTLIRESLRQLWKDSGKIAPSVVLRDIELSLTHDEKMIEIKRPIGNNEIGMVAWKLTLFTPEFSSGRDIILIANDITHRAGSFGPKEDLLFYHASALARRLGIPRLYFAANSGARVGLASELLNKYQIAWVNNDPQKGLDYLYLSESDFELFKDSVVAMKHTLPENNEVRYIIKDIIGKEIGIGVENLSGSGMIAGESSCAYDEIFTLSYVSGRTVGIGAYLVRLGQRIIQKVGQPILLTGYRALNKLLGKEVYTSNTQLGGTGIMYPNGISHLVVQDDLNGVMKCLKWLSYVPAKSCSPINMRPISILHDLFDPINRPVCSLPLGEACDPRDFISGRSNPETNEWFGGLFDRGSFMETLPGWAQTIVVGRARLGEIPVGVISVETRTKERTILADPANPDSKESVLTQAGQVWFPDSSFKTAQSILDMNREGLPLFILANWRGFSGGMRDMFDEILKYGSYIVDALREYNQPVFVYLVPHGELRGGAWVVLDSTINPHQMEMYADPTARGGILEPAGILDVKYRPNEIKATMHRTDSILKQLSNEMIIEADLVKKDKLRKRIAARESELYSSYVQAALKFVDLHDTPVRMKAMKVISSVVEAKNAREFFFWRLRRRLIEMNAVRDFGFDSPLRVRDLLRVTIESSDSDDTNSIWSCDAKFCEWYERNLSLVSKKFQEQSNSTHQKVIRLLAESGRGRVNVLANIVTELSPEERLELLNLLKTSSS